MVSLPIFSIRIFAVVTVTFATIIVMIIIIVIGRRVKWARP